MDDVIEEASRVYSRNFDGSVWFERSVFINWTCAIADCKYCYLSTKPKLDMDALRSQQSILAEVLVCRELGWKIGYITGGLRVESTEYLIELAGKINSIIGEKTMMNFGPYHKNIVQRFKPVLSGMGCAVESFDEKLHNFICPSKPLKSLLNFLGYLEEAGLRKLITIILGLGEKKEDIELVMENIERYNIDIVQLCFLKSQKDTIYEKVPPPDPEYMSWWIAKLRVRFPKLIIKIALVPECVPKLSLMLEAGANCFSRFMPYKDFGSDLARELERQCETADRDLIGNFTRLPDINLKEKVAGLEFDEKLKENILVKAEQYYDRLGKAENR